MSASFHTNNNNGHLFENDWGDRDRSAPSILTHEMQNLVYFLGTQNIAVWWNDRSFLTVPFAGKIIGWNVMVLMCNAKMLQIRRRRCYCVCIWGWRPVRSCQQCQQSIPDPLPADRRTRRVTIRVKGHQTPSSSTRTPIHIASTPQHYWLEL